MQMIKMCFLRFLGENITSLHFRLIHTRFIVEVKTGGGGYICLFYVWWSSRLYWSNFAVGLVSRDSKHHSMSEIDASCWSHPYVARCILWMTSELAFLSVWMVLASGDPICSVHDSAAAVCSNWRDEHCIFTTMEKHSNSGNKYHTFTH